MYITSVPNRNSPPAVLLRESYRDGGKVRNRTLANLSKLPSGAVEALRKVLRGGQVVERLEEAFDVVRSRPHGHVAAVLGTLRQLGLGHLIDPAPSRKRDLCIAMVVERILDPRSKLATARGLDPETLTSSLAEVLGIESATEDDLYEAMDWILERQPKIETALAKRHLREGGLALWDLTSSYVEGRCCPLGKRGHSRDGKRDRLQITDFRGAFPRESSSEHLRDRPSQVPAARASAAIPAVAQTCQALSCVALYFTLHEVKTNEPGTS
jgi:hypothetical protein